MTKCIINVNCVPFIHLINLFSYNKIQIMPVFANFEAFYCFIALRYSYFLLSNFLSQMFFLLRTSFLLVIIKLCIKNYFAFLRII